MPRPCSACVHPKRVEIDAALSSGTPYREVGAKFGLSASAIDRHRVNHIAQLLAKARTEASVAEVVHGTNLATRLHELAEDARRIQAKAEDAGELDTALRAIGQLVKMVELLGKAEGELGEGGTTVNVAVVQSTEWVELRARIVAALAPFPEAKAAVLEAIR